MYHLILYHRVAVMREVRNLKVFQTVSMVTHLIRTGTCLDMATVCCTHDVLMRYHMAQMFEGKGNSTEFGQSLVIHQILHSKF